MICGKNRKTYFIRVSRTYVGDEVKEVVDWLIASPYNSWKEKDREYLMNCDSEKNYINMKVIHLI